MARCRVEYEGPDGPMARCVKEIGHTGRHEIRELYMTLPPNDDLEVLRQGKPYIRSILAFILHLRHTSWTPQEYYRVADAFIKQLEEDVKTKGRA